MMWECVHAWLFQSAADVASVSKEEREKAKRVTYGAPLPRRGLLPLILAARAVCARAPFCARS